MALGRRVSIEFLKALAAIIGGNALYFLALVPHLPAAGRHQPFQTDLGLWIDFCMCVAAYGAISYGARRFGKSSRSPGVH